jgi:hypothetical protein
MRCKVASMGLEPRGWSPRRTSVWIALAAALAPLGGCGQLDESCQLVGRAGGLIQSADSVLSIAVPPEALDESIEFCVAPPTGKTPPASYGPAYRVAPATKLSYSATISYRFNLPHDTSETNIGFIDDAALAVGMGDWVPLETCRIEHDPRQVQCKGGDIEPYYALLDGQFENVTASDTLADTGSSTDPTDTDGGTGMTAGMTTATTMTTTMTTMADTGMTTDPTDPTNVNPIDYPPECDDLASPPFDVFHAGQWFDPWPGGMTAMGGPLGAEDMAPDGQGGFVGRHVNGVVRIDVSGATFGMSVPDADPSDLGSIGITRTPFPGDPDFTGTSTLGIRYTSMGDIAMLQLGDRAIDLLHQDGTVDRILQVPGLPNAVYADLDGALWYSEYSSGNVRRYDIANDDNTLIANLPTADGLIYDPLRMMLFYVRYDLSQLWRIDIAADGSAAGQPTMVTDLQGFSDGVTLDVCGNLYVVDQGGVDGPSGQSRVDRVFMTDGGDLINVEEIAADLPTELANPLFGLGADYGEFEHVLFLTGQPSDVYYIDVQITGAAAPVLR